MACGLEPFESVDLCSGVSPYWVDVDLFALGGFLAGRPLLVDWLAALSQDEVVALALELGRPFVRDRGYCTRLGAVVEMSQWKDGGAVDES